MAKYSALVGEVTWASNNLHATLYFLFQWFFPGKRVGNAMATELWHSLRSDDMQRIALRALLLHSIEINDRQRTNFLWTLDAAGRLSEYRNDAIHTTFDLNRAKKEFVFQPSNAGPPKRVEKLRRVGHAKLFRCVIGDLNQINDYALSVWEQAAGEQKTLPKRPVLQSVRLVEKSPPKHPHPTQRPQAQKHQRPPSRVK